MSLLSNFSFNFKDIIIEEIALNGLEGIDIKLLWKQVEKRIASHLTEKMKTRFWDFIVNAQCVTFYHVPDPLPDIDVVDRFCVVDEDSGYLNDAGYIDGPYEYHPVLNEYGSCQNFKTRTQVERAHIAGVTLASVMEYSNTLVMVASLEERWKALAPHMPIEMLTQLTPVHYCLLELIGRGRENGQMTVGATNLTKIVRDSKLLFYNRKHLQELDLVRVQQITQMVGHKATKTLLLTLKRYHKPILLCQPKVGRLRGIIDFLMEKPNYAARTDMMIKSKILTQPICKRLQKSVHNIFGFKEDIINNGPVTNTKGKEVNVAVKKRFIYLNLKSDESSDSEEETNEEEPKCQYKVGIGLLRQAYEMFLEAGRQGLTQIQLSQLLGIEFYTCRSICRIFKTKHIIREYLEDKGRQRMARYIAVAAKDGMEKKYAEEKEKFLEYLHNSTIIPLDDEGEIEVPRKKIKLEEASTSSPKEVTSENLDAVVPEVTSESLDAVVTEVTMLESLDNSNYVSLLNSKKLPTLRQLKYANGILKITRQHLCVIGYQSLSMLVAKEIGEPPMDAKAIKLFIQKLVFDRQIKILQLKWPINAPKHTVLICAPHISSSHPKVKKIYKDICIKARGNMKMKKKRDALKKAGQALSQFAYPRYMKLRKLHEIIFSIVHLQEGPLDLEENLPKGFTSISSILPEMTVEFAIGNISNLVGQDIPDLGDNDKVYRLKLRDAPIELYKQILESKSFQSSIKINMKVLATNGLIQFIKSPVSGFFFNSVFYVNKCAKILDTTGLWPRNVPNFETLERTFYFNTYQDVENYWQTVSDISINTIITVPKRNQNRIIIPSRLQNKVDWYDTGERFGDGLGPCGFDSSLYMDIPRLWSSLYRRTIKTAVKNQPKINIPKRDKSKKKLKTTVKKSTMVKNNNKIPVVKKTPVVKGCRKRVHDSVVWSASDDATLNMCKAAITIMSPNSQPGCLRIRNVVAKDILTITDPKKTSSVCHRRIVNLENNLTLVHEREVILNELRHRPHLIHKYEGLVKKIRLRNSGNITKFINDCRKQMLELVWIISKLIKSKHFNKKSHCIATNLEDFHKNYTIVPTSANRSNLMYQTPLDQYDLATLKEAIVMTVMYSTQSPQYELDETASETIYSIFKDIPEMELRSAVDQLRKSGAVSAREKLINAYIQKLNSQYMMKSCYKISHLYFKRLFMSRLNNSKFLNNITDTLENINAQDHIKASPGLNCVFFEFQAASLLNFFTVTEPVVTGPADSIIQEEQLNVIDVEAKYKIKSGTNGWKSNRNINTLSKFLVVQENDVEEALDKVVRNSIFNFPEERNTYDEDGIVLFLKNKGEKGATFIELLNECAGDIKVLSKKLTELESELIIKRVGYYENRIVLTKFIKPWAVKLTDKYIIPCPWIKLNQDNSSYFNYDIFIKWAGSVLNKVFESPGCSIALIIENSCEYLTTRAVQELCIFLEACKCVTLKSIFLKPTNLFSDDDCYPDIIDYIPYFLPEQIIVFPVTSSLTLYTHIRKIICEKYCTNSSVDMEES